MKSTSTCLKNSNSSNSIFNIAQASVYNYNNIITPSNSSNTSAITTNTNISNSGNNIMASNLALSMVSASNSNLNSSSANAAQNQYVEIQAQIELCVELRRFINIDLFQRGYYQIRLSIKCNNKQIPTKILVQLENTANNANLSGIIKLLFKFFVKCIKS